MKLTKEAQKYFLFQVLLILVFAISSPCISAQSDSAIYDIGFPFRDGIYASFQEFKANQPSILHRYESRDDQLYVWEDSSKKMIMVDPQKVWGYSKGSNVYISYENAFWRLINIGQLSHFSAIIIRTIRTMDSFGFPVESESRSIAQLFLDFKNGKVYELSAKKILPFVEKSPEVMRQYPNLKRIKARGLVLVLKMYNDNNPIYFPYDE